jgi:hypothetical protein
MCVHTSMQPQQIVVHDRLVLRISSGHSLTGILE